MAEDPQTTDERLIELWLHGKSQNTIRSYRKNAAAFLSYTGKQIRETYLSDVQGYVENLTGSTGTRALKTLVVKSLFTFAFRLGYVPFNVGSLLRTPRKENKLAQRILTEEQVLRLLEAVENHPRDHAMIRLLYSSGVRISECLDLRWDHIIDGVINVLGKGERSRVVRPSEGTYQELLALRPTWALPTDRVFDMSCQNARLRVHRAARKAGVNLPVTPHFFRHSHASHALEHGSNLATIKETLGHANIATTNAYLHARPGESSSSSLIV